jgi:hypothetical protein
MTDLYEAMAKVEKYFDGNLIAVEKISSRVGNKSFLFSQSRGSSVVEQPIRNRSCAQGSKTFPNFAYEISEMAASGC